MLTVFILSRRKFMLPSVRGLSFWHFLRRCENPICTEAIRTASMGEVSAAILTGFLMESATIPRQIRTVAARVIRYPAICSPFGTRKTGMMIPGAVPAKIPSHPSRRPSFFTMRMICFLVAPRVRSCPKLWILSRIEMRKMLWITTQPPVRTTAAKTPSTAVVPKSTLPKVREKNRE